MVYGLGFESCHEAVGLPKLTAMLSSQGGAYLTLLNTIANMGVILPKLAIFAAIDWLSARTCVGASSPLPSSACPS